MGEIPECWDSRSQFLPSWSLLGLPATQTHRVAQQGTHLVGFVLGEAERDSSELGLPSRHTSGSGSKHGGVGGSEQVFNSEVPAVVSA